MIFNVILILFAFLIVCIVANLIGNFINSVLKLDLTGFNSVLGYGIWVSLLFIVSQISIKANTSSETLFFWFTLSTIVLVSLGLKYGKFKVGFNDLLVIISYVVIMILVSLKYTMGEELGDNIFLINLVTKNVNAEILNNFNISTGSIYEFSAIGSSKEALTFYHFFAYIINIISKISTIFRVASLPYYVYYIWVASLFFYYLSIKMILAINIFSENSNRITKVILIIFIGFYIGSYYFNVNLAYYGITYMALITSLTFLVMVQYIKSSNKNLILILFFLFFAMYSHGAIGLITSSYLLFGFIATLLILKDDNVFLYAFILLLPIVYYSGHLSDIIPISNFQLYLTGFTLILCFLHYIKRVRNILIDLGPVLLLILWLLIIFINISSISNYSSSIFEFFEPKENFDRVRDYFTLNTPFLIISNLIHYLVLAAYFIRKDHRRYGLIFAFILVFFMNPFVYPLLYKMFSFHYHRAYYTVFNLATLGLGLVYLVKVISKQRLRIWMTITLTIILGSMTFYNITRYESILYIPGPSYNPFYKLDNDEIDILEVLRTKISIEEYVNPKVISQIYGTQIYVPEVNQVLFNTQNRRAWDPDPKYRFDELYKIFYTPVFAGDDGPRFEANGNLTCSLLIEKQIDFVIYDKSLSVYDEKSENWIPNHWYARSCAEMAYENERYILYRFYWK